MKRIGGIFFTIVGFILFYYCAYMANKISHFSFKGILAGLGVIAGAGILIVGIFTAVMSEWPWHRQ